MSGFFKWAFDDAPEWVAVTVMLLMVVIGIFWLMAGFALLFVGYWVAPLIMWVVIPSYFVFRAYAERDRT